jgi:hypothetical protein
VADEWEWVYAFAVALTILESKCSQAADFMVDMDVGDGSAAGAGSRVLRYTLLVWRVTWYTRNRGDVVKTWIVLQFYT